MNATALPIPRRHWGALRERARTPLAGLGFMLSLTLVLNTLWGMELFLVALPDTGLGGALRDAGAKTLVLLWCWMPMQPVGVVLMNLAPPRGWQRWAHYAAALIAVVCWCILAAPAGSLEVLGQPYAWTFTEITFVVEQAVAGALSLWSFHYYRTAMQSSGELARSQLEAGLRASELRRTQLQLLRAQIEPHFLFNTLANIRSLARIDRAGAVQLIDRVMSYLEAALPQLRAAESSLGEEMALVDAYLAIYQVRMGSRLGYEVALPAMLASERIPTMLLLTLVENALKHGVNAALDGGRIHVSARLEDDALVLEVADSGRGLAGPLGLGEGLANARMRLLLRYGAGATLSLAAAEPRGVVATVRIPQRMAA